MKVSPSSSSFAPVPLAAVRSVTRTGSAALAPTRSASSATASATAQSERGFPAVPRTAIQRVMSALERGRLLYAYDA